MQTDASLVCGNKKKKPQMLQYRTEQFHGKKNTLISVGKTSVYSVPVMSQVINEADRT